MNIAQQLAREMLKKVIKEKSLKTGTFKLASGVSSDLFFDMKKTALDPKGAHMIASIMLQLPEVKAATFIGGVASGGIPIVAAMSCLSASFEVPKEAFFVRTERKKHGTESLIEGNFVPDMPVVLIEDVITTGGSVLKAVKAVREAGGIIDTVITVVDRLQGGKEALAEAGINLVSIFTKDEFLEE